MLIDTLRQKHSLCNLLSSLRIAKSSYFYQRTSLKCNKYEQLRVRIFNLFHENQNRYGYRRIKALLAREDIIISEKVVRKIMKENFFIVKIKKKGKYNSYKGEVTPAPPNLLERNFHSEKPNTKWLTDVTEFNIPSGKIYLSSIIDCFDGLAVSWTIGTNPNASLVNDMLDSAVSTIKGVAMYFHPRIYSYSR